MIQVIINSIVSGLLLALVAYGFSIVFQVTRVFHLAQAALYALSGYVFVSLFNENLALAIIGSLTISLLAAFSIEKLVYVPLFRSGSNQIISLISSIGVNVVLINTLALIFGSSSLTVETGELRSYEAGNINVTQMQLVQLMVSLVALISVGFVIRLLKVDLLFKATATNDYLAGIMGINVPRIRLLTILIGSALVAIASMLSTADIGIDPYSGVTITLTAAVVAILTGSIGLVPTILVSIALALIQNMTEWYASAQWKEGITFVLLLLVMLWRTEGIVSYSLRKDLK